jgi:hypothetical protein
MDKLQTENSHPDSKGLRQRSEAGQNTEDPKDQEASEKSNGFVVQKVSTQFLVIELILVIFFMALYFYGQPR